MNAHLVDQNRRIDETNNRIYRLYEVIVRRDEHEKLDAKLTDLENRLSALERKLAA